MKKAISLFLVLLMCLSLCACGGGNSDAPETTEVPTETTAPEETVMTKEELLSIATNYHSRPLSSEMSENIAKASNTYLNQTVSIMGINITEINIDHVVAMHAVQYNIYLPPEDLAELEVGDYVRVVGTISKFDKVTVSEAGTSWDMISVDITPAYIVDKYFELSNGGLSYIRTDANGNKYCFIMGPKLVDRFGNYIVYFSDEDIQRIEELSETQLGVTINFHGNLIGITWEDKYGQCMLIEDAVIDNLE